MFGLGLWELIIGLACLGIPAAGAAGRAARGQRRPAPLAKPCCASDHPSLHSASLARRGQCGRRREPKPYPPPAADGPTASLRPSGRASAPRAC